MREITECYDSRDSADLKLFASCLPPSNLTTVPRKNTGHPAPQVLTLGRCRPGNV